MQNKFFILLALSLCAFHFTLKAQSDKRFQFGVKGGVAVNYFSGNHTWENQRSESLLFGALSEMKLKKHFALRLELLYTTKGVTHPITVLDQARREGAKRMIHLAYLELPVSAKFSVGQVFRFYYMPGIAPALLVNNHADILNLATHATSDISFPARTFDLGVLNTIGFEVNNAKLIPFVELRANNSMLPMNSYNLRNNQLSLATGIKF
jgi:hypothetical protein